MSTPTTTPDTDILAAQAITAITNPLGTWRVDNSAFLSVPASDVDIDEAVSSLTAAQSVLDPAVFSDSMILLATTRSDRASKRSLVAALTALAANVSTVASGLEDSHDNLMVNLANGMAAQSSQTLRDLDAARVELAAAQQAAATASAAADRYRLQAEALTSLVRAIKR
jgi:hypothetical protein